MPSRPSGLPRFSAYVENLIRWGSHYNERDVIHLNITTAEKIEDGYRLVIIRSRAA